MKKKKTVIKIILVIMLGIGGTISTFTNRTLANVDKININVDSITKETTEVITLVANTEDENIKITQIELPNGAIVNGSEIEYTTNENGIYEFEVFYEESTLESNVIESSKIISYEVTSMEKHDVIGEVVKQNRTLSPRTIVKNGTIGTVNWTLDDTGGLTFDGGVFPNNYNWNEFANIVRADTKTVTFTAPITAGNNLNNMFKGCSNLTDIYGIDKLDTSNVTNMSGMFIGCRSLTNLDLSSFNTSNVIDMFQMFSYCESLINLDVSNFDTSNVTNMAYMFNRCISLTNLDLNSFNTSNVIDMNAMFSDCESLINVDVSSFDTSNVTMMREMFISCESLINVDVSNFDTSNARNIGGMFNGCRSLTNLDLSSFNTSNVIAMDYMFSDCENLINVDVSNFDTSNVMNMGYMFYNCKNLTNLDVSNFDTINALSIYYMFSGCTSLTKLDISKFDLSSTGSLYNIFENVKIRELTLGSNFRFIDNYHALSAPLNNEQYTGNWQLVSNKEVFTHNELLAYDGTKQGTYVWEIRKYDVNYDSQGGSAVANETVEYNQKVTQPTEPTRVGYTFGGWYKEAGCTNEWNFTTDVVANDVTLYAKWNLDPVEIVDDQVVIVPTNPSVQTVDTTTVGMFVVSMLGAIGILLILNKKHITGLK